MQAVWFRNDLRTHDHYPLNEALDQGETIGLYIFDPRQFENTGYGFPKTDSHRARFLIESVHNLRKNMNGNLIVSSGKPEEIIPDLVEKLGIVAIHYHTEVTSEEKKIEEDLINNISIPMYGYPGHTMYHAEDLPFEKPNIPDVFTSFRKKVEKKSRVREPLPVPSIPGKIQLGESIMGSVSSLKDLGLDKPEYDDRSVLPFKGGEDEAWNRLNHYFFETDELRNYKFKRNGLLGANYSSKFSPWLAHGCISARAIHQKIAEYEENVHKNVSTYWLTFELIWRDYFHYSAMKYGNDIFKLGGIQKKNLSKNTDEKLFWKWAKGQTGIPFIDANMRELNQTGFMSNRGRQNVASFLAQNLNFDWRWGAAYFESKLIDYDVCSNWGNWAYNATVGHDPRNRYFNIINQARKYDKKGEYVRHWLPELKELPAEFIHEPYKMTTDQQKLFDVQIGADYPEPVLDLDKSYEEIKKRD